MDHKLSTTLQGLRRLEDTETAKFPNTKFWNGSSGKAGTSMAGYKEHTKKSSISLEGESSNRWVCLVREKFAKKLL